MTTVNTILSSTGMPSRWQLAQNYLVIWVDSNIDMENQDCKNTLVQLHSAADQVYTFTEPDECVNFLIEAHDQKVFLILPETIGQQLVPLIHDIPHLDSVYIIRDSKVLDKDWSNN
ncbi:unnamed protein product [Rotaria sp. Silwood2]|nr:unnamed protein product [Rotaria sp. Silwood2]